MKRGGTGFSANVKRQSKAKMATFAAHWTFISSLSNLEKLYWKKKVVWLLEIPADANANVGDRIYRLHMAAHLEKRHSALKDGGTAEYTQGKTSIIVEYSH